MQLNMDPLITECFLSAFEIYPEEFKKCFVRYWIVSGQLLITKANDIELMPRSVLTKIWDFHKLIIYASIGNFNWKYELQQFLYTHLCKLPIIQVQLMSTDV
jgi:hypothetical protein